LVVKGRGQKTRQEAGRKRKRLAGVGRGWQEKGRGWQEKRKRSACRDNIGKRGKEKGQQKREGNRSVGRKRLAGKEQGWQGREDISW